MIPNTGAHLLSIEILAKQVVEGFITGLHKSPYHGFSVEFAEHKPYNTGASTRNIDWKLFARTDKLYTKHYEEETNLLCRFVLDVSPSMVFPEKQINKLQFSTLSIAALMQLLQKQRDAFGLIAFDEGIRELTEIKSTQTHRRHLMEILDNFYQQSASIVASQTSLAETLHRVAEQQTKRSLIVVFSDFLDKESDTETLFSAFRHLQFNKHEVVLFNVLHKDWELEFNLPNKPFLIQDAESLEKIKLYPDTIREAYAQAYTNHLKALKEKAFQYRLDWNDAFIEQGYAQVLNTFLLKRQRLMKS
jgi:uncharacterized protein (DUF58 family)